MIANSDKLTTSKSISYPIFRQGTGGTDCFQGLNDDVETETRNMTIYSVVLVIVTTTCLLLSLWYARKLGDMLSKMAKHAQKLQVKSVELSAEKRRADTLLCQMLPKEVAEQLKMNKEVKAEQSKVKAKD